MEAIKLLFGSDIGLLSVFTIVVAAAVVGYLYFWVRGRMDEDAAKQDNNA